MTWLNEKYDFIFRENTEKIDSTKIKDSNNDKIDLDSINIELKDSLMIRSDLMKSFRENLNIKEDSNLYKQKQNIIDSTKVKLNSIVE